MAGPAEEGQLSLWPGHGLPLRMQGENVGPGRPVPQKREGETEVLMGPGGDKLAVICGYVLV